jgi:hypothetical protein
LVPVLVVTGMLVVFPIELSDLDRFEDCFSESLYELDFLLFFDFFEFLRDLLRESELEYLADFDFDLERDFDLLRVLDRVLDRERDLDHDRDLDRERDWYIRSERERDGGVRDREIRG